MRSAAFDSGSGPQRIGSGDFNSVDAPTASGHGGNLPPLATIGRRPGTAASLSKRGRLAAHCRRRNAVDSGRGPAKHRQRRSGRAAGGQHRRGVLRDLQGFEEAIQSGIALLAHVAVVVKEGVHLLHALAHANERRREFLIGQAQHAGQTSKRGVGNCGGRAVPVLELAAVQALRRAALVAESQPLRRWRS